MLVLFGCEMKAKVTLVFEALKFGLVVVLE
jgi:hypothetical protein